MSKITKERFASIFCSGITIFMIAFGLILSIKYIHDTRLSYFVGMSVPTLSFIICWIVIEHDFKDNKEG